MYRYDKRCYEIIFIFCLPLNDSFRPVYSYISTLILLLIRRQRILERRASERSETATTNIHGRVKESSVDSVSSAEITVHTMHKGHENSAFDGEKEEMHVGSVQFENVDLNDDNYLSLNEVEEGKRRREDCVSSLEAGTLQSLDARSCLVQEDKAIYDNNV